MRDFYAFFFLATLLSWIPFFIYVTLPANPVCGPLRTQECALGFNAGNRSACIADTAGGRKNVAILTEFFMPEAVLSPAWNRMSSDELG